MAKQWSKPFDVALDPSSRYTATLATNHGEFEVEFFADAAPQAVNNFVSLAREGFYDGTSFHRVVRGFVIQGGDPTGTGSGGPGYRFADELPVAHDYERGTLAMANAGPNTNGSQFFVCLTDLRGRLPKNYTIFGRVVSGMETVDAIGAVQTQRGGGGEQSKPVEPVRLDRVSVSETPVSG